ncbi:hypothetical protein [Candidatus Reidiella endopervernicosa]|uniref:Uncharacterized protein n=1 Tax=Candidatus Reidiella endopervernicosa TaxID=2738883 RepID=A0A6N0HSW6_9GAMM|nr:hypothetical protein [Candidatus Reidiella endopervernicosa]QKQ25488.1 hypothetical protein HUE57_03625 [Candidatus Reidiella endopervernicosa]
MDTLEPLTLTLDTALTNKLCQQIEASTNSAAQRVAALVTLQTFISATSDSALHGGENYTTIRNIIDDHTERARRTLMVEQGEALKVAVAKRDVASIAHIYTPLSRSGFWKVMEQLAESTEKPVLESAASWCKQWCTETKQRGETASPYHDAINFKGAGIDIAEYTAMGDLNNFLQNLVNQ